MTEAEGVRLRPTTAEDLVEARRVFQDPGFFAHWDGRPKSDEEIGAGYLGSRSPAVECFFVEVNDETVGLRSATSLMTDRAAKWISCSYRSAEVVESAPRL